MVLTFQVTYCSEFSLSSRPNLKRKWEMIFSSKKRSFKLDPYHLTIEQKSKICRWKDEFPSKSYFLICLAKESKRLVVGVNWNYLQTVSSSNVSYSGLRKICTPEYSHYFFYSHFALRNIRTFFSNKLSKFKHEIFFDGFLTKKLSQNKIKRRIKIWPKTSNLNFFSVKCLCVISFVLKFFKLSLQ